MVAQKGERFVRTVHLCLFLSIHGIVQISATHKLSPIQLTTNRQVGIN